MTITFYTYPKCSTCRKAKKWLEQHGKTLNEVHLVEETPSADTLRDVWQLAGVPLKRLFNTSGKVYREMKLKNELPTMSEEEQLELLASNGMLIKRPIATDGTHVTIGFKEETYEDVWNA